MKLSASNRSIPAIRVVLTSQGPRLARPICDCRHAVHFEHDVSKLPEGNSGSNHLAFERVAYIVRSWDGSTLICAACDRAGHTGRASS